MLEVFEEFRKTLDDIMLKCMHSRITIYGYDTYTGRFLMWYASYYHGVKIDYLVSEDMGTGKGYDREVFRPSVFEFGYKDVRNTIIWMAQPLTDEIMNSLSGWGYIKGQNLYDFYDAIYGDDVQSEADKSANAFEIIKSGKRDIQFLEWLEWKKGCNFITPIEKKDLVVVDEHGHRYSCSTQKEIFPMLEKAHVHPSEKDAIFDFGCGKGGAMVSFLDYGFLHVGGVEYEPQTYEVAKNNFEILKLDVQLICGDARGIKNELDQYNWFYFFFPFDKEIFQTVIDNIQESYLRNKRKIHIIYFTAMEYGFIEETGVFRLTNQFTVDSRQRVVGIFESY